MEIEGAAPRSRRLEEVIALHRRYSRTLGFLPAGAFEEYAADGTLIVAVSGAMGTVGYALYDLPRDEVALRHLCIDEAMRGQGVARLLVEEIASRHRERRGIRLRCRRDWDANEMWSHLDFEPLQDAPGRSAQGHLLTTWWRDFGHPTLFSVAREDDPAIVRVAIDTDVFLDLGVDRPGSEESRQLLTDWVVELAELLITKELVQEIDHHQDASMRRQNRHRLQAFRRADASPSQVDESLQQLVAAAGGRRKGTHDIADMRHVARAHAGGCSFFLTRDQQMIKSLAAPARSGLGIEVLAPAEFIQRLWVLEQPLAYAPASLENTEFRIEVFSAEDRSGATEAFLDYGAGERATEFHRRVREHLKDPDRWDAWIVREPDGRPVGMFVRGADKKTVRVPILRVAVGQRLTVARHLIHLQRQYALEQGCQLVRVEEPRLASEVVAALKDEGFAPGESGWCAVTVPGVRSADDLVRAIQELGTPGALGLEEVLEYLRRGDLDRSVVAEVEARFWPVKLSDAPIPTFLVPVRAAFAEQLFDTALSERTLFPRQASLGLSREHVYYRSPRPAVVSAPARLLWYVSHQPRVPGTGAVRACSSLVEIVVDRPRTLYRRFRRLGVYRRTDVEKAARDGRAMAMRFVGTELLKEPVPFSALQRMARRYGHTLSVRSPWRLPERMFEEVYRGGTAT